MPSRHFEDKHDILIAENWQLLHDQTYLAQEIIVSPEKSLWQPIPPQVIGGVGSARLWGAFVGISFGKPSWRWAGTLEAILNAPFAEGAPPSTTADTESIQLKIARSKIFYVETFGGTVQGFRFQPPPWFRDCQLKIWRYEGGEVNFATNDLTYLKSTLDSAYADMNADLEAIKGALNI